MARVTAVGAIRAISPPWLRRTHAARVMESIAESVDTITDRVVQGVKLRFPGAPPRDIDEAALALIGRERRIRRGATEPAETYAARLLTWWDAHRTRGGPYALLEQMYAYFRDALPVRIDVVYHSGTRRWIDTAGVITRDAITWNADGTSSWARFWVFFHITNPDELSSIVNLITQGGDQLITQGGDPLVGLSTIPFIVGGAVSDEVAEWLRVIPREWSAAHIDLITIVLLYDDVRLWGYPQPVPTWGTWGTWQEADPVVLTVEG